MDPNIPVDIKTKFELIDELHFNCFELHNSTNGDGLRYLIPYLFETNNLYETTAIDKISLINFSFRIQKGYLNNPYHNKLHGFDVCQTVNFFLTKCKFIILAELTPFEIAAMYLASAVHDFEHP